FQDDDDGGPELLRVGLPADRFRDSGGGEPEDGRPVAGGVYHGVAGFAVGESTAAVAGAGLEAGDVFALGGGGVAGCDRRLRRGSAVAVVGGGRVFGAGGCGGGEFER